MTAWLEAKESGALFPGFQPGDAPDEAELAIKAWNLMGGIAWEALPIVVELLGIEDVGKLVEQLIVIRNHQNRDANG